MINNGRDVENVIIQYGRQWSYLYATYRCINWYKNYIEYFSMYIYAYVYTMCGGYVSFEIAISHVGIYHTVTINYTPMFLSTKFLINMNILINNTTKTFS